MKKLVLVALTLVAVGCGKDDKKVSFEGARLGAFKSGVQIDSKPSSQCGTLITYIGLSAVDSTSTVGIQNAINAVLSAHEAYLRETASCFVVEERQQAEDRFFEALSNLRKCKQVVEQKGLCSLY